MARRGWNNIQKGFQLKTGINLSIKQLKNRWPQCKVLYTFWNKIQNDSGLGRRPDDTIIASAAWWKRELQVISL